MEVVGLYHDLNVLHRPGRTLVPTTRFYYFPVLGKVKIFSRTFCVGEGRGEGALISIPLRRDCSMQFSAEQSRL